MPKLFGTDGMRGEAGKFPLDAQTVAVVGHSLATHLKETLGRTPIIVVGRDTRASGEWLEKALISGASSAAAICKSAGVITTPGVAYLARTLPADAGIVISASHNPYQDNGIKIFAPNGRKLDEATERQIELDILSDHPIETSIVVTQQDDREEISNRYLEYLYEDVGSGLSLRGKRIVLDCANGAASEIAPKIFRNLGGDVTAINNNPDGRNINVNCGSLHMEALQAEVLRLHADLGVAVDGDADRSLFVDANGEIVNGDAALWVLAKYLQDRDQLRDDTVVATVMSNIGLELALQSRNIKLVRTDVGDKYVLDELLRLNASLGGEQSGHIIFPAISLAGDGLITTLCLLRAMVQQEKPLSDLVAGFQRYPQILVNVRVKEKLPFTDVPAIVDAARELEERLGANGRLLLRYSGTEPLARVMLEGKSQSEIQKEADNLAAVIRENLGPQ